MSSHIEKVVLLQGVRSSSFVCHQTVLDCERIRAGGLDEMVTLHMLSPSWCSSACNAS
jgi:hypothetical protein